MLFHQVSADETASTASSDHYPILNSRIGHLTIAIPKSQCQFYMKYFNGFVLYRCQ